MKITLNSINEFLENRKEILLNELKLISYNFEEMNLNNNENFDYPFIESFDDIVAELSEKMDYEDIKIIHTKMIKRLEEANKRENR